MKKKLDAAVKAGKLTQAQADEMQARMTEHLDDLVNGTGRGPGGHHGGIGHMGTWATWATAWAAPRPGGTTPSAFVPAGSPA